MTARHALRDGPPVRVAVPAFPGCVGSAVHGIVDVLAIANWEHQRRAPGAAPLFRTTILTPAGDPVPTWTGEISGPAMTARTAFDVIVVPPWLGEVEAVLRDARIVLKWLQRRQAQHVHISSVCSGSFLLAEAGLLDHRTATTHWFWAARFRERYPKVRLRAHRMLVDEGDIVTAGGMTAYFDLCLHLIRRVTSADLAAACARLLLVDTGRTAQSSYEAFAFEVDHGDVEVLRAQQWMAAHRGRALTLGAMAASAGLGLRTFMRRFKQVTGHTPVTYLQRLRVHHAKALLESTRRSSDEIASVCGYENTSAFHRVFVRHTGVAPGEYRRRVSTLRHDFAGPNATPGPPDAAVQGRPRSPRAPATRPRKARLPLAPR